MRVVRCAIRVLLKLLKMLFGATRESRVLVRVEVVARG
jgi:hypothetical protein